MNKTAECIDGINEKISALYIEAKTPIYTFIYRIVHSRAIAEDVLHDAFLKLCSVKDLQEIKNLNAWVYKVAYNLAIDSIRRPRPQPLEDDGTAAYTGFESTSLVRLDIEKALSRLEDTETRIITLHINAGLKFREVADVLAMPLGTVLFKYYKAIDKLRDYLTEVN